MIRMAIVIAALLIPAAGFAATHDFMRGRLFQIALEIAPDFTPMGDAEFGTLATSERQSFAQTLTAGTCYTWLAVGENGQADVDMAVFVQDAQVTGDTELDDWPVAQYCATADVSARVDIIMYSGAGSFALATLSKFFGGADEIELNMNYLSSLYAAGMPPVGPITRVELTQGGDHFFPLALDGGSCYTIIGTSGPGVVDTDLFLMDATGALISADDAVDNFPVVGLCAPESGNFSLRALMYAGNGELGWRMFRSPISGE